MNYAKTKWFVTLAVVLVISCDGNVAADEKTKQGASAPTQTDVRANIDPKKIQRGRQLYLKNCTVCHGINAEGSPDWRQRDAEGKFPPPPLNGTGHAWHHPQRALMDTIKNGTQRLGGNMPPWKDRLSDAEIELIILWFQTQWPDQLYEAWQRMDREAQQRQEEKR